jgi:esterase/lipase superfamily enzyme
MTVHRRPRSTGRAWRLAVACLSVAATAGCGNTLMPTPVGFDREGADPFLATPEPDRTNTVRLFVATTRAVDPTAPLGGRFSNRRSDEMHLATLDVRIGDGDLDWTRLVEISRQDAREDGPGLNLVSIDDFGPATTEPLRIGAEAIPDGEVTRRFNTALDEAIARGTSGNLYVFIHGFNTDVPGNAAVGAELFHYLSRDGAFVLFEWPSRDSVFDYDADKYAAAASTRHFRRFIEELAVRTSARRIHILAHSAGAPIAVQALQQLSLMNWQSDPADIRRRLRLGRLVLVAPDMDLGDFRDAVSDRATELPERVTLYVSSRDRALDISAWIAGFARLGRPLDVLTPKQIAFLEDDANVDLVDVMNAERNLGSWLGHSYFHEDPWVSTDVLLTMATSRHPIDRGLHRDPVRNVYVFGPNYPKRARDAARDAESARAKASAAAAAPAPPPAAKETR